MLSPDVGHLLATASRLFADLLLEVRKSVDVRRNGLATVTHDQENSFHNSDGDALAPGSKLLSGQYEIIRYLSSGGFGITYLAKDSLNRTVVIKECFPEAFCSRINRTVRARTQNYLDDFRSIVKLFIREAHALSRLDHPSVVGVHQVFEDNETAYMALDLVDGKDLLDIIEDGDRKLSPAAIKSLTLKLLDAIGHVHSQDLLHRDISPDNILVDKNGHPVLIDFGAAREEASRKSRVLSAVLVVKDGYSPQEFYVAGSQQLPCSDLYAFAATLAHLITGEAPPNSQARLAALASNQPDPYEPLLGRFPDFEDVFLQAIDQAMSIAPAARLQSAEDWVLMIDHTKRVEIARQKASNDKSIDRTVMKLVRQVNSAPIFVTREPAAATGTADGQATAESARPPRDREGAEEAVVEDLRGPSPEELAMVQAYSTCDESERPLTPYARVTSRALQEVGQQAEADKQSSALYVARRGLRLATVPVIFCAYFFYAQLLFQHDAVQAATIQPLIAMGLGQWANLSIPGG